MTQQGVQSKLGYRICDWIGQTLIEPLPHPHLSTWNTHGFQVGAPGSSVVGDFTVPLWPPRSDEYAFYKREFDLVRKQGSMMRIEGYILGPDGEYMFGIPVFSGIITKITHELDKFEIQGFDTFWLAQQQVLYPGQSIAIDSSDARGGAGYVFSNFNRIESLLYYDDFNGHTYPLAHADTDYSAGVQYTFPVGASWGLVTDEGLKAYRVSGTPERIMLAQFSKNPPTSLFLSNFFSASTVVYSAWFHVTGKSLTSGISSTCELVLGDDGTGQNHVMARALLSANGTTFDVLAEIWTRQGGTYTNRAAKTAFTGLTGDFRCQVIAIMTAGAGNQPRITVLINGKDTSCTFDLSTINFTGSGNFYGFRWSPAGAETATLNVASPCLKRRHLSFDLMPGTSQNPYAFDGVPVATPTFDWSSNQRGGGALSMNISGMTFLDLWAMAASMTGWVFRKHANRLSSDVYRATQGGAPQLFTTSNGGGDFINWGSPGFFGRPDPNFGNFGGSGVDLTKSIILDESREIISGGAAPNAESAGNELKFGFSSAADGSGQITWPDPIGLTSLGRIPNNWQSAPMVIQDIINMSGSLGFNAARTIAQSIATKKSLPSQAKTFTIHRTLDIAAPRLDNFDHKISNLYDSSNYSKDFIALNPQAFAEQDIITLNVPTLDINMTPATVVGYTFRESDPTMDIIFDQHPTLGRNIVDRRRLGVLDIFLLRQGGGG